MFSVRSSQLLTYSLEKINFFRVLKKSRNTVPFYIFNIKQLITNAIVCRTANKNLMEQNIINIISFVLLNLVLSEIRSNIRMFIT